MTALLRQAKREDIPGMHRVRCAVRENPLPLGSTVVTEAHYIPAIEETGRGWVIQDAGEIVGFSVGTETNGNIWALFVDPRHEGRGYGRQLHDAMVAWMFSRGLQHLNLGTAPGTRAQRFYETAGWRFAGMHKNGEALYTLDCTVDRIPDRPQQA